MVDAMKILRKLKEAKKPVDIETNDKTHENEFTYDDGRSSNPTTTITANKDQISTRKVTFDKPSSLLHHEADTIELEVMEDPSGSLAVGTGATIWDCSLALTLYLIDHYDEYLANKPKVLELGAGCGLPSMALAKLGCRCMASERELTLRHLQHNIAHNHMADGVQVISLDWNASEALSVDELAVDIVIGADLIFPANYEIWSKLADLYAMILKTEKATPTIGFLAYEPRNPSLEADFFDELRRHGIAYHRAADCAIPKDIHIYRLSHDLF
jgi:predicted nicotinamide N-methyase